MPVLSPPKTQVIQLTISSDYQKDYVMKHLPDFIYQQDYEVLDLSVVEQS